MATLLNRTGILLLVGLLLALGLTACAVAATPPPSITATPWPTATLVAAASPSPAPGQEQVSLRAGQREGSLLVENIYPDRVTGLNFPEYPIATSNGYPVTLRVGEAASNGCTVTLTLLRIEGELAIFAKATSPNRPCPICLARDTLIATPQGMVKVQHFMEGGEVWSLDSSGARVSVRVLQVARTGVPFGHRVVHLTLADGRELFASLGHPMGDGRLAGDLASGDLLEGVAILAVESVSYQQEYTYDILPSGETGLYWANGILVGSTLFPGKQPPTQ